MADVLAKYTDGCLVSFVGDLYPCELWLALLIFWCEQIDLPF